MLSDITGNLSSKNKYNQLDVWVMEALQPCRTYKPSSCRPQDINFIIDEKNHDFWTPKDLIPRKTITKGL